MDEVLKLDEDGSRLAAEIANLAPNTELVWNGLVADAEPGLLWTNEIFCPVVEEQLGWHW